jgi:hypothetical protein
MSRTRISDGLSELDERVVAAAEADLDLLLALEPAPDFAARVLARISAEHASRGWRMGWAGVVLASAATLVITFTLRSGSGARDRAPSFTEPLHHDVVLSVEPLEMHGAVSLAVTAPKGGRAAHRPVGRSLKAAPLRVAEPEVLIDPLLGDAVRRLAVSTRNVLLDDTTSARNLQPASDVPVPSVVVEPLTVPELVLKPADQNGGR